MDQKHYTIGEKKFIQEKLAWRQIRMVLGQVAGVTFVGGSPLSIVQALGERLGNVLGIVLRPETESRESHMQRLKEPEAFGQHVDFLETHVDLALALEVVRDFLEVNRISYVLSLVQEIQDKISKAGAEQGTELKNSVPPSAAATPPLETVSST